jgi:hypothetical protein
MATAHEEAQQVLAQARQRGNIRAAAHTPINYEQASRTFKRLSRQLTTAINSGDKDKVILACRDAVAAWSQPDMAWPDNWPRWQAALNDVLPWHDQVDLKDLR